MSLTRSSSLREVVRVVSRALGRRGIRAVLTGGACASLYCRGEYLSHDLDYVLQAPVSRDELDAALAEAGLARHGATYMHPKSEFFVEFPAGPLAIGDDDVVEPIEIRVGGTRVLALSATDSCRDRLAAFYHWRDRQSLRVAAAIARYQRVDLDAIRRWSAAEGADDGFREFEREVRQMR